MNNCNNLVYSKQKQCIVCTPGYYFKNGVCHPCDAGEGCAVCDYRNIKVCLFCLNGYHQKTFQGTCTKSAFIDFDSDFESEDSDSENGIARIIMSLVSLMILF